MTEKKRYHIVSLGCPKNLVDSEVFSAIFTKTGYKQTTQSKEAEIVLINTCSFIEVARAEAINEILKIAQLKQKNLKTLIVTGCLVKQHRQELAAEIPEVDHWIDLKDFETLYKILSPQSLQCQKPNRRLMTPCHYAYLRISDGCDNRCAYCTIPNIRGGLKSEPIEALIKEAEYLASKGVVELIITAQDTTMYGVDLYGKPMLVELLRQIEALNAFPWIRLMYLHPAHLTHQMIRELRTLITLLPYFDLPLQHTETEILEKMNRKIDKPKTKRLYNYIRKIFPDSAIRTTLIVGFPGEDRSAFTQLENILKKYPFERLGVFVYSKEEDTPAAKFTPQVELDEALWRQDRILKRQRVYSADFLKKFVGKTLEVIIDKKVQDANYKYVGRSFLDAPDIDGCVYISDGDFQVGEIVNVRITDSMEYDLEGVQSNLLKET
ncbi:MAG: 30S ribosomal protein S12 methylthiotransferase RimO [Candidatus Cloacimonetes bacterium]|nr:30S ribosomal protein S12 methylthiotransferase RimO [Candidatus Cloacimonadota bacterium]